MNRTNSGRGSAGCGGCLCMAFMLSLFAVSSPYWVWRSVWSAGVTTTTSTGSYVASSNTGAWSCGWYTTCMLKTQWNHFSDFNNTLCETSNYELLGEYGFCTKQNGEAITPSPIASIQGLAVSTTVFLFVGSLAALAAPAAPGGKSPVIAAVCCFVAVCTSCASFSIAVSYNWYQELLSGRRVPMPFITTDNEVIVEQVVNFWWGPGFWSTVIVFIITLLATPTLCAFGKVMEDDDLDGTYGSGSDGYKRAPDMAYGQGQEATMA